jgi:hypothetical protein
MNSAIILLTIGLDPDRMPVMRKTNPWTPANERSALSQGWSLFTVDSGDVVIQKMDDPPAHALWEEGMIEECPFNSDGAAIRFVRRIARTGDETAMKAIKIHDENIASWRRWRRTSPFTLNLPRRSYR